MREVTYHSWLSNPVLVKKHDGNWRMYVDFPNLNKACPKDCYPLSEIDWKVESLCGYPIKYFLDAYKGYHQIHMAEEDEEKTAFHTSQGVFCYRKMPFRLKNVGATYQRLVDKAFDRQIGRNLEVYMDDLVIKSYSEEDVVRDIAEMFRTLRKINMKLNPINVQYLNGKLASLNRFLSKAAEKSLLFFKTLKRCIKKSDFAWIEEAEKALKAMKKQMAKLPTLMAPVEGETLIMYLSAAEEAISDVLLVERGDRQILIYFVGSVLQSLEINYTPMEKLILALIHAARRLRRYFQAHPVAVITDQPIRQILSRIENSGRLAKWAIELGEHAISYRPRTSIRGQVLADFLAEMPTRETCRDEETTIVA
ncbi:reverse transcriptase domain-containing protein [Tanacetum coccineum]|uniref:Reverse transcriptase domain-containing protein n=1 Tax=Tanacetum coccineum TaxID=301880 RepID=A0ABQ5GUV7_9ASTR